MRSLKFRAWDIKRKTYDHEELLLAPNGDILASRWQELCEPESEYIIEQYTGLKDKNGKEIYEGDIVDYNDDGECIGVVKYDAPEFYLDADATNWARMFLKGAPHQKVIGNIHESPELLEQGDAKD
jgi:hypothetical protein